MELTNREIALVIWAAVVILWTLSIREVRLGLVSAICTLARPPIGVALSGFVITVILLVAFASSFDVWCPDLVNETVLWFFAIGLVMFFNITAVSEEDTYFRRAVRSVLPPTIFVEGFVGIVVLPLPLELVLLPVVTLLTAVLVVTESRKKHETAERAVNAILAYIGLGLLGFVGISLLMQPSLIDVGHTVRAMALPLWLTLGVLPFLYALGLYAAYDGVFKRIRLSHRHGAGVHRSTKLALLSTLHLRAGKVGAFKGPWLREAAEAQSYRAARGVVARYLETCES